MATFTSTVPVPTVTATGLSIPAFEDIYSALLADYMSVYGADVDTDFSDQDMQWIGIQATAMSDMCSAFAQAYNSFSPATAQGTGLSSVVKVNGIAREVASFSTVDVLVVGQAGTIISNGVATDEQGANLWSLPATVIIPTAGQALVTATCQALGAVQAAEGTITQIATPTRGWQSVSNPSAAAPGAPVETDPALRIRQTQSTMLAATGVVDSIVGAVSQISGVARVRAYENDTSVEDVNNIPGHTISLVVDGGDAQAIAAAIAARKLSAGTYGTTTETVVTGVAGIPRNISFFRPTEPSITWGVSVKALSGYTTDVQAQIQQALSDWTNNLGIGAGDAGKIMLTRAYAPALLVGTAAATTFELLGLTVARDGGDVLAQDVLIAFNEAPFCMPSSVTVTATT